MRTFLILFLLVTLAGCTASAPPRLPDLAMLSGKASAHNLPQAGVEVQAWPLETASLAGSPPYRSPLTDADGLFSLRLPAGEYYLLARGKGFFAYYGRNPVTVASPETSELNLGLVSVPAPPKIDEVTIASGVAGTVQIDGQPQSKVVIYAYTDLSSRLKGMGYALSTPTDDDGRFELELPAGTYYLLARMRKGGGMVTGPLRAGDQMGYAPANPVRVADGKVTLISIPLLEVPDKVGRFNETLFGQTVIKGRILNKSGAPVSGARAILYNEPQMLNRPLYVSQPTAADGTFVLSFPSGGTYYLAARQELGGAPAPGELYGTWDGSPDHALTVTTGEQRSNIIVTVAPMW